MWPQLAESINGPNNFAFPKIRGEVEAGVLHLLYRKTKQLLVWIRKWSPHIHHELLLFTSEWLMLYFLVNRFGLVLAAADETSCFCVSYSVFGFCCVVLLAAQCGRVVFTTFTPAYISLVNDGFEELMQLTQILQTWMEWLLVCWKNSLLHFPIHSSWTQNVV